MSACIPRLHFYLLRGGLMFKKICGFVMVMVLCLLSSGCALVGTALSAAAAYGIYQATHK